MKRAVWNKESSDFGKRSGLFSIKNVHRRIIKSYDGHSAWSEWRDSNSRPLEPHSSTLPSCATPRLKTYLQAQIIIPQRQDLSRGYFGFAARLGIGTQYVLDRERKPADPDGRTALKAGLTVENAIDGVLRFLNRHHLVNRIPKQKTDLDFRFMQIHALIGFIEHFSSGTAV